MNKRTIMILAIFVILCTSMAFVGGCSNAHTDKHMVEMLSMGPNDQVDSFFYRVVEDSNGNPHAAIAKMNVDTSVDTIVYEAEENRKIYDAVECGEGIVFALTRPNGNGNYLLMFLDANDNVRTLYEADHEMIIKNINGRILFDAYDGKQNEFNLETLEVCAADFDEIEKEMLFDANDVADQRRYIMRDGTEVVIKKAFEENSFTYKVDGKDNSVACISGEGFEYAQWGNLSDKDGILYGAMAIPKKTNNMRRRNVGLGGLTSDDVIKELLFSIDVASGENKVIYETTEGHIVGHADEVVYLFKNGDVYKKNISSGEEEFIGEVPCDNKEHLEFRWIGSKLFIFELESNALITTMQG